MDLQLKIQSKVFNEDGAESSYEENEIAASFDHGGVQAVATVLTGNKIIPVNIGQKVTAVELFSDKKIDLFFYENNTQRFVILNTDYFAFTSSGTPLDLRVRNLNETRATIKFRFCQKDNLSVEEEESVQ